MNTNFWNNPSQWPRDAADAIFLARAFHEIGRAMFGLSWTGQEPSVELPLRKPEPLKAEFASDAQRAQAEMVQERVRQRYERVLPLYDRAQQVQVTIATRASAGEIKTKLRPVAGGQLTDIPAHYWDTEKLTPRFAWCQMSLAEPFGNGMGGKGFGYIFIERASLDRFLLSQPFAEKPTGLDIHLSPFLQTLVTVARKMQITPANQPKKEAIMEEIKLAWTGQEPLGKTLVEYMATILREPESQLGRGNKKKS